MQQPPSGASVVTTLGYGTSWRGSAVVRAPPDGTQYGHHRATRTAGPLDSARQRNFGAAGNTSLGPLAELGGPWRLDLRPVIEAASSPTRTRLLVQRARRRPLPTKVAWVVHGNRGRAGDLACDLPAVALPPSAEDDRARPGRRKRATRSVTPCRRGGARTGTSIAGRCPAGATRSRRRGRPPP
jgi:hypothetical protein